MLEIILLTILGVASVLAIGMLAVLFKDLFNGRY